MNRLRVFVLILVSLLLPLRGAVAAAMQCQPARAPAHVHGAGHAQAHVHAAAGHGAADHGAAAGAAQTTHHEDGGARCSTCASGCCAPCMVGPSLQVLQAPLPRLAAFPPLAAPPARFISEGPERPPRAA